MRSKDQPTDWLDVAALQRPSRVWKWFCIFGLTISRPTADDHDAALIGTDLLDVQQNRDSIRAQGHLIWPLEATTRPLLQEFQFANETKRVKTNEWQPLVLVDVIVLLAASSALSLSLQSAELTGRLVPFSATKWVICTGNSSDAHTHEKNKKIHLLCSSQADGMATETTQTECQVPGWNDEISCLFPCTDELILQPTQSAQLIAALNCIPWAYHESQL